MFQKSLVIIHIHNWLSRLCIRGVLNAPPMELHLQFPTNFSKSLVRDHTHLMLLRSFQKD